MSPWSHYVSHSALPGEGVGSRKGADTELISLALRRGTEKGGAERDTSDPRKDHLERV